MKMFGELLRRNKDAIVQRWLDDALATYPEDSSAAFERQKDPFANPVGHSLREGTQGIFEALLEGTDAAKIRQCLLEIIKIRAVQQFSPSQAVGFIFGLKDAVRAELGEAARDSQLRCELAELDGEVDRIALAGFDIFVECREQVYELRINELKLRTPWVVKKRNERDVNPKLAQIDSVEGV
jgi:hypothetical protein